MERISFVIPDIASMDNAAYSKAKARLDSLAKPPGSLGRLEEIAARISGITGTDNPDIGKRRVIVLAADNGIVAEGVASAPQAVTAAQTINIACGVTGVGVLAKLFNTDICVADVGVNAEFDVSCSKVLDRKIRKSTGNIAAEPAMTREEAEKAVNIGIELAKMSKEQGYRAIGVGEMGIGNTTTSSAVLSALLELRDKEIDEAVGRGAGLDDAAYIKKINVVKAALTLHKPDKNDVIGVLSQVGGLDIAAMTGVFIGAASNRLPVVIDGFISAVAALCAVRLAPNVRDYLFASHKSAERGYVLAVRELGLSPCLDLDMRLGEGSGCPLMFAVMDASLTVLKNMATFGEARIDEDYLAKIDKITF